MLAIVRDYTANYRYGDWTSVYDIIADVRTNGDAVKSYLKIDALQYILNLR